MRFDYYGDQQYLLDLMLRTFKIDVKHVTELTFHMKHNRLPTLELVVQVLDIDRNVEFNLDRMVSEATRKLRDDILRSCARHMQEMEDERAKLQVTRDSRDRLLHHYQNEARRIWQRLEEETRLAKEQNLNFEIVYRVLR